jgi:hypothetical protein
MLANEAKKIISKYIVMIKSQGNHANQKNPTDGTFPRFPWTYLGSQFMFPPFFPSKVRTNICRPSNYQNSK